MNLLQKTALVFTVLGAIAWGMIGLFDFNIVTAIFGIDTAVTRIIYTLVGIAGLINLFLLFTHFHETHEPNRDIK